MISLVSRPKFFDAVPLAPFFAICFMGGCAVGPDFQRPAKPETTGYTAEPLPAQTSAADVKAGEAQRFNIDQEVPHEWWTLFQSPTLNALIAESFKANPSIASAQAALKQAHEQLRIQQTNFFPAIEANFTPERYKNAVQPSPTLQNYTSAPFNLFTAQVSVSYVPDLWGLNRRSVESLEAQEEMQRDEVAATYLSLSANVVNAAIQEASLQEQIVATRKIIDLETAALGVLNKQYDKGQVAGIDVAAQEAILAQAEASLPPLEKQLAQQQDLLAALAGRLPGAGPDVVFDLKSFELPQELPVVIPSKLVEQRPDIRAAEEQLRSANANIGVAIANFFPNLTLSAGTGTVATQINQLFQPFNGFWTLSGSLTQTVFDAGALLHKRRQADAAFEQAAADYKSTVISAFQNVADSLRALQFDADGVKANLAAEKAAERNLNFTQRQLELGAVGYIALLTAEQTYQQAVINLVQAKASRFSDTAALYQAMGGGWWDRPDLASTDNQETPRSQKDLSLAANLK